MKLLESRTLYGAIRKDKDEERVFVEVASLAMTEEGARVKAEFANEQCPAWGQAAPVQRIGKFILQEVE